MDDASVELHEARGALDYVEHLLSEAGLPAADVRSKPECFYIARAGGEAVGVGGIETCGTEGLLRSVVVERSARGNGFGTRICDALEIGARSEGIETLYLLTTTARNFFADRGYVTIKRSDVPPVIRDTDEFAELCPASATCMRKRL